MSDKAKVVGFTELVTEVASATGTPAKHVKQAFMGLRNAIVQHVLAGNVARIRDIGSIRLLPTEERQARNPRTGEIFTAPPGFRVKFAAGSAFDLARKGEMVDPLTVKPAQAEPELGASNPVPAKPEVAKPASAKPAKPGAAKPASAAPANAPALSKAEEAELDKMLEG